MKNLKEQIDEDVRLTCFLQIYTNRGLSLDESTKSIINKVRFPMTSVILGAEAEVMIMIGTSEVEYATSMG